MSKKTDPNFEQLALDVAKCLDGISIQSALYVLQEVAPNLILSAHSLDSTKVSDLFVPEPDRETT